MIKNLSKTIVNAIGVADWVVGINRTRVSPATWMAHRSSASIFFHCQAKLTPFIISVQRTLWTWTDVRFRTWLLFLIPSKPEERGEVSDWKYFISLLHRETEVSAGTTGCDLFASRQTEKSAVGIQLILFDIRSAGQPSSTLKCTSDCDSF